MTPQIPEGPPDAITPPGGGSEEEVSGTRDAEEEPIRRSRTANGLILTLACGLAVTSVAILANFLTARSRDAVVEATSIEIKTPISGILLELKVKAGEAVSAGQSLGRVEDSRASGQEVRNLKTSLLTAGSDLEELDEELAKQRRLVETIRNDAEQQKELEIERSSRELQRLEAELRRSREEVAFIDRDLKRQQTLFRAGAVAETVVDRASTDLAREREQLAALEERLAGQKSVVAAARKNLTLTTTRSNFDPAVRLQESKLKLQRLEGRRRTQAKRVEGLTRQLETAGIARGLQSESTLVSPREAVVWKLLANQGDTVRAEAPVLQLIDCKDRFITTFVKESDLNRVRIGSPARIDLVGDSLDLRGEVATIRSGLGRVSLKDDTNPIPINLARESQVRVRILNDIPAPPLKFCYVGFTARVSFER